MEHEYTQILQSELAKRMNAKRGYSLRAFSRDLGMTPGQMSRVLKGSRNISPSKAKVISEKLFRSVKEKRYFVALVEFETSKDPKIREAASLEIERNNLQAGRSIALDQFSFISQWYHSAILALIASGQFPVSERFLSKKLGVTQLQAHLALKRLDRMGLIQKNQDRWSTPNREFNVGDNIPSDAIKKHHEQMIQLAQVALQKQSLEQRSITGRTLTIDKKQLPQLMEKINEFRNDVARLAGEGKSNSIYQLNIQFFDLEGLGRVKEAEK